MEKDDPNRPLALIVDDDKETRFIMSKMLKSLGLNTREFSEPKKFLLEIKKSRPSICFVDLNIDREGNGFLVIQAIRNVVGPKIPLIVISSRLDSESIDRARSVGASDYLSKPIVLSALAEKIGPYLKGQLVDPPQTEWIEVPQDERSSEISFELNLKEVHEHEVVFESPHALYKGLELRVGSPWLEELMKSRGFKEKVSDSVPDFWIKVSDCQADSVTGSGYTVKAKWIGLDNRQRSRIRGWICRHL